MSAATVALGNGVRVLVRALFTGRPRERIAGWTALLMAAGFALGEIVGLRAMLNVVGPLIEQVPKLRVEVLIERILRAGFGAAAFLLVLGSLTTAVSTLFLSEELPARLTLPFAHRRVFLRQAFLSIAAASSPTLLVGVPAIVVAARASRDPLGAFLTSGLGFLGIVVLAAGLGTFAALVLVRVIPPRRARLLAAFLSAAGLAVALVGFRTTRPERLLDPIAAFDLLLSLGNVPLSSPGLNPVAWAARAATASLMGDRSGVLPALVLFLGSLALVFVVSAALAPVHLFVFRRTKEEEGLDVAVSRGRRGNVKSLGHELVSAELRSLLRDASTPAQLGSLAAVFVLDLLNVRLLPTTDAPARDLVAGLQEGLALFLVSALSLRFAYPAVSSDGRSAFVLRTLPLSPARHLLARYVVRCVPASLLALVLVGASDVAVRPPAPAVIASLVVALVGGLALPALNLGLGGLFPRYGAPNAITVALGPGGLLALTLSTLFSLAATVVVSEELRALLGTALHVALRLEPLLGSWLVVTVATCALPVALATRSLRQADVTG